MSASAARKPVARTVYVTTEVEIDPYDLESEGWVYVGDEDGPKDLSTTVDSLMDVVRRWHDDTHPGLFQWCVESLCREVREAVAR